MMKAVLHAPLLEIEKMWTPPNKNGGEGEEEVGCRYPGAYF